MRGFRWPENRNSSKLSPMNENENMEIGCQVKAQLKFIFEALEFHAVHCEFCVGEKF